MARRLSHAGWPRRWGVGGGQELRSCSPSMGSSCSERPRPPPENSQHQEAETTLCPACPAPERAPGAVWLLEGSGNRAAPEGPQCTPAQALPWTSLLAWPLLAPGSPGTASATGQRPWASHPRLPSAGHQGGRRKEGQVGLEGSGALGGAWGVRRARLPSCRSFQDNSAADERQVLFWNHPSLARTS